MKKENTTMLKAAIITMSFVQMGTNGIAPILADIAAAFPEASASTVQFLMTFPSIFMVIFSLLAAALSDRLPQKLLAITGLMLVAIGGVLACLIHGSLTILFVWAAVIGIGIGMVAPIAPSLVNASFTGAEQQSMLGIQNSSANIGSMLMTFFGGFLAALGWPAGYLVYLVGLPGVVCTMLGMREQKAGLQPVADRSTRESATPLQTDRPAFRLTIIPEMLTAFFFLMCFSAVPANISMLVSEKGIGGAALAGTMSTIFLLGGTLMGLIYGKIAMKIQSLTVPLGALALAMGALLIALAPNTVLFAAGCFIGGMSISLVMPSCMAGAPKLKGYEILGSALILASSNVGVFVTPLLTSLTAAVSGSEATANRFLAVALVGTGIMAVTFVSSRKKG